METGETSHNPEFDSSLEVEHFAVKTYTFVKIERKPLRKELSMMVLSLQYHVFLTTASEMTQPSENILHPHPPGHRVGPLQPPDRLMCSNPTKSSQSPGNLAGRHPIREAAYSRINTIYCNLHCGFRWGLSDNPPKQYHL